MAEQQERDAGLTWHGEPLGWHPVVQAMASRAPQSPGASSQPPRPQPTPTMPAVPDASVDLLPTAHVPAVSVSVMDNHPTQPTLAIIGQHLAEIRAQLPPISATLRARDMEAWNMAGMGQQFQRPTGPVAAAQSASASRGGGRSPQPQQPQLTPRQWVERYGGQFSTLGQAMRAMPAPYLDWSEDDNTTMLELRSLGEAYAGVRERYAAAAPSR